MRSRDLAPLVMVAGLVGFVFYQIGKAPDRARPSAAPADTADSTVSVQPQGSAVPVVTLEVATRDSAPARDLPMILRQISDGAPGTYIYALLQEEDNFLMRWPDRRLNALRVWIDRSPSAAGWQPSYAVAAGAAFDEWRIAGFPIAFDVLKDSVDTQIQIRWVTQFEDGGDRIGTTLRKRDRHGWITSAEITIATHQRDGTPNSPELVAGIARHEVGHALGLGHSPNATDVMFAKSETTVISAADRATLHLLYKLPPGPLK